jgi:predicted SPOUT superfamily RNA methylase MTH1
MNESGLAYTVPLKRSWKLTVAVPNSLVADVPHLREKTSRLGFLGRALGIFRVDEA